MYSAEAVWCNWTAKTALEISQCHFTYHNMKYINLEITKLKNVLNIHVHQTLEYLHMYLYIFQYTNISVSIFVLSAALTNE
jgi:hypothetical protein